MSLTPFSVRVIERAIAGTFIAYLRNNVGIPIDAQAPDVIENENFTN